MKTVSVSLGDPGLPTSPTLHRLHRRLHEIALRESERGRGHEAIMAYTHTLAFLVATMVRADQRAVMVKAVSAALPGLVESQHQDLMADLEAEGRG